MTQNRVILHDFRSIPMKYRSEQKAVVEWIAETHAHAEGRLRTSATSEEREELERRTRRLVTRFASATDRVQRRGSALEDFTHHDRSRMRIFGSDREPQGAGCGERNRFYAEVVGDAFRRFYVEETEAPSALVHVTCTGYESPSGAQLVVADRGWGRQTEVFHAYHMGCYASLPAIRLAEGFLARGKTRVDVVHTELCSLHLDPTLHTPEQLVAQTLFSDGLIRYSVAVAKDGEGRSGLEVLALREELIPGTKDQMGWGITDHGMRMTLSREVIGSIASVLPDYLERLAEPLGIGVGELRRQAVFAIHPGGPRIIDQIQELLGLADSQVAASNAILREHGNMSSATLPHVWRELVEGRETAPGTRVVSLAFGPGLTVSGAVMRKA